jgi:hypothetical protein
LKLLGHVLFPWAERLLWIDAKLRLGATDPLAYVRATTERRGACASFVGLPFHSNAYGPGAAGMAAPSFAAHGETLLRSLRSRPTLTDDVAALEAQLATYSAAADDAALSAALIDSALVARDLRSPRCRRFHAALGCAWFDAGRDAVVFNSTSTYLGRPSPGLEKLSETPVCRTWVGEKFQPM